MGVSTPCIDRGRKGRPKTGFLSAWVLIDGKRQSTTAHRKAYYEHTGEWPEVVQHTCGNPRCINPEHLQGGTHKSKAAKGSGSGRSRLNEGTVRYLRQMHIPGDREWGSNAIARRLGMAHSVVYRMLRGITWHCVK